MIGQLIEYECKVWTWNQPMQVGEKWGYREPGQPEPLTPETDQQSVLDLRLSLVRPLGSDEQLFPKACRSAWRDEGTLAKKC